MKKLVYTVSFALLAITLFAYGVAKQGGITVPESYTHDELYGEGGESATLAEATLAKASEAAARLAAEQSSETLPYLETTQQTLAGVLPFSTYTGYPPLPLAAFTVKDPENSAGLSTEKISYGYGIAKNGTVSSTSKQAQDNFDLNHCSAISYDNKSAAKTLYLTFDCGYENGNTSKILDTLAKKNVPAAFFCTVHQMKSQPELTARMILDGHILGNHSNNHPDFAKISKSKMSQEILECDNYMRENFGYTSRFFRFPEGSYSQCALELVGSMGYTSVFWSVAYVDWETDNQRGGDHAYNTVTSRLHDGAILLLHSVSSDNAQALGRIIDSARADGYEFRSLEQYGE